MDRIGAVLVDTYRIERLIAEGGMGAVYEASHVRIPKKFAIKFLKISLLDNSVALMRFRREAEVVATLDHPAIVSLIDYNITDDGVPYTVLEYLEGEHLGDRVSRGRLPLKDIVRVADAVAGALAAAHDKGVIHRDLKPENVILCNAGAIKVVDFGIAKLRGAEELTAFNSILGTITYMAPEQLMAGQIDGRADQFALGAMIYEMLSGEMPFGSEGSIPEIAERVLRQDPPPIPGYPASVYEVVLRAMAKDAGKRYPDVQAFLSAFKATAQPILDDARAAERPPVVAAMPPPTPAKAPPPVPPPPAPSPAAPPPVPPVASSPTGPTSIGELATEEVPELPGEATSISLSPLPAETTTTNGKAQPSVVTGEVSVPAMPAEQTRITPPRDEITDRRNNPPARPEDRQLSRATGRMAVLERSLGERLGERRGIVVGVVIGVVLAAVVSLVLR